MAKKDKRGAERDQFCLLFYFILLFFFFSFSVFVFVSQPESLTFPLPYDHRRNKQSASCKLQAARRVALLTGFLVDHEQNCLPVVCVCVCVCALWIDILKPELFHATKKLSSFNK